MSKKVFVVIKSYQGKASICQEIYSSFDLANERAYQLNANPLKPKNVSFYAESYGYEIDKKEPIS